MKYLFFLLAFALVFRSEKCAAQSDAKSGFSVSGLTFTQRDTTTDRISIESLTFPDSAALNAHMAAKLSGIRQARDNWRKMYSRDSLSFVRLTKASTDFDPPGMIRIMPQIAVSETKIQPVFDGDEMEAEPVAVSRYRVIWVRDADTYTIETPAGPLKIRPVGFDADEIKGSGKYLSLSQPFGEFTCDTLRKMLTLDSIDIQVYGFDVYGRTLARVAWRGLDLATLMLRNGWADYLTSPHLTATQRKALQRERDAAKRAKRGRWSGKDVITPRQWRKKYKV